MSQETQPLEEPLSERELDVLEQLMSGATNKEIAAILTISPNTVKVHLRNIYSKLNVSSRTEASMMALELGLFAPPGEAEPETPEASAPTAEAVEETADEDTEEAQDTAPAEPLASVANIPTAITPVPPAEQAMPEETAADAGELDAHNGRDWRVWAGGALLLLLVLAGVGYWLSQTPAVTAPTAVVINTPTTTLPTPPARYQESELSEPRWFRSRPLPLELDALALVSNGLNLYQIGGLTETGEPTELVHVYDTSEREWRRLADKPTPVSDTSAAVLLELYVPGGRDATGEPIPTVEVYSPLNDLWRQVADLPQPLAGGLALANNQGIYLFGGWNGTEYVADSYLYDPVSDTWRPLPPMQVPRAQAVGGLIEGRFYVVGGENETGALSACEVFDPANESWSTCADLTVPRRGGGAAVVLNNLYVMGGTAGDSSSSFSEVYNPADEVWRIINQPNEDEEESVGWADPAVASVETRIYVLGGNSAQNFVYLPPIYQTFIPAVGGDGE